MVDCKEIDINGQEMDESGYYLKIKIDFITRRIGVMICNSDNVDIEEFWGRQSQDIYHAILNDNRSSDWFTDPTHVAYLGKELKKAEITLATGGSYYQE